MSFSNFLATLNRFYSLTLTAHPPQSTMSQSEIIAMKLLLGSSPESSPDSPDSHATLEYTRSPETPLESPPKADSPVIVTHSEHLCAVLDTIKEHKLIKYTSPKCYEHGMEPFPAICVFHGCDDNQRLVSTGVIWEIWSKNFEILVVFSLGYKPVENKKTHKV